jgi:hypothetical protein
VFHCGHVCSFFDYSMPSDQSFRLYHTSIDAASNVDEENAVGKELIRRGRSVLGFLVDW